LAPAAGGPCFTDAAAPDVELAATA